MIAVLTPMTWPALVDQRAAGVAGIERGVGLDDVLDQPPRSRAQRPAERAHHAGRDRVLEPVGIADRDHELPARSGCESPKVHRGEAGRADSQHRQVGVGIVADQVGPPRAAVGQRHVDLGRALDDMAVGEDQAVGGKHEPGAGARLRAANAGPVCSAMADVHRHTAGATSSTAPTTAREYASRSWPFDGDVRGSGIGSCWI